MLARARGAAPEEAVAVTNADGAFMESVLVWLRELEDLKLKNRST